MSEGKSIKVLGPTYEPGKPDREDEGNWKKKLTTRQTILDYLRTAERYWYSDESYGSEKRKNPA